MAALTFQITIKDLAQPGRVIAGMLLAAGENIASWDAFEQVLAENVLGVVQPGIAKWGSSSLAPDWRVAMQLPIYILPRLIETLIGRDKNKVKP